ncbi:hypothetical protein OG21DRAFT_1513494 [Imleria badia]|nr:hypothetical protein OG21DRAFT_1513494 [Imleria badia]
MTSCSTRFRPGSAILGLFSHRPETLGQAGTELDRALYGRLPRMGGTKTSCGYAVGGDMCRTRGCARSILSPTAYVDHLRRDPTLPPLQRTMFLYPAPPSSLGFNQPAVHFVEWIDICSPQDLVSSQAARVSGSALVHRMSLYSVA